MKYFSLTKRKILNIGFILIICIVLYNIYKTVVFGKSRHVTSLSSHIDDFSGSIVQSIQHDKTDQLMQYINSNYQIKLTKERVNKLFKILKEKEELYKDAFNKLDLLMFDKLNANKIYQSEIKRYFNSTKYATINNKFIDDLKQLTNYYSYVAPRNNILPEPIVVSTYKCVNKKHIQIMLKFYFIYQIKEQIENCFCHSS